MINGDILKFGAGDICVDGGITDIGILKFHQIKPPQDVGTQVIPSKTEFIGSAIVFDELDLILDLMQKINQVVAGEYRVFDCGGFVFDFSDGDPQSIEVVKRHVERTFMQMYIMTAC